MKSKIYALAKLLSENRNRKEVATLKQAILKEMKIGEVHVSEKYRLVFEKRSKKKLLIRALITRCLCQFI